MSRIHLILTFQGQLSDYLGRRNVLMIALIGTSVSYFLLGTVESILFLGLARVPSGKAP